MPSSAMELPSTQPRPVQGQWRQGPPSRQHESSRQLDQLPQQKKETVVLTPSSPSRSVPPSHVIAQAQQETAVLQSQLSSCSISSDDLPTKTHRQDRLTTWHSLIASVFDSEAYTKALYRPAGSWVDIISIVPLSPEMASLIYSNSTEAFIVGAQLSNRGEKSTTKAYAKSYFIVPTSSPVKACTGYLAEWSEEDYAYIVCQRVNTKSVHRDDGLAFEGFNFDFGRLQEASSSYDIDEDEDSDEEHDQSKDVVEGDTQSEDDGVRTESSLEGDSSDELTSATTPESNSSEKPANTGELDLSIQSWIASAAGRDWADIDEEEQEEDLALASIMFSDTDEGCVARPNSPVYEEEDEISVVTVDEVCFARPSTPTPYDQDDYELAINQLETLPPSTAILALTGEESEDDSSDEEQEAEALEYLSVDSFAALESNFWNEIHASPESQANPVGQPCNENYQEPSGDYHALSFACYPQNFRSTTSAAVSLWAVTSSSVFHHVHGFSSPHESKSLGVPFTRQSILAAQACKTVNPIRYDGPGDVFANNVGTRLHDSLIGWASNTFLPVGRHVDEPVDPENPRDFHLPTDSHWSVLTVPRTYLTPPYIYDYRNPDHDLPTGLQGGTGKSRRRTIVSKASGLRNVELCYDTDEEEVFATMNDEDEHMDTVMVSEMRDEVTDVAICASGEVDALAFDDVIPDGIMSDNTIPEHIIPDEMIFEDGIPDDTISEDAIPEHTISEDAIPEDTIPENVVPDDIVSEDIISEIEGIDFELDTSPAFEPHYNQTITTRSATASFGEGLLTGFSWTAAGTILLAAGIVVGVFRALRR